MIVNTLDGSGATWWTHIEILDNISIPLKWNVWYADDEKNQIGITIYPPSGVAANPMYGLMSGRCKITIDEEMKKKFENSHKGEDCKKRPEMIFHQGTIEINGKIYPRSRQDEPFTPFFYE